MRFRVLLAAGLAGAVLGQAPPSGAPAPSEPKPVSAAKPSSDVAMSDDKPVVTKHELVINGRTLKYEARAGYMPLRTEAGDIEANLFHVAYRLETDQPAAKRPLTFCFNGGPGAGSLWLHLGAIGPMRVRMLDDGSMPPPPYELVANDASWLDKTDLVFIDPVGTGFSRAKNPEIAKKFFGVRGDIESVGQFIRLYLNRSQRQASPLFLAGESYGTFRAAGVAGYLSDHGISLNGITLISSILNFQTARFAPGNDLPYSLFLPTYTAAAWYHKKVPADLQANLEKALGESRRYAGGKYLEVLHAGDRLSDADRKQAVKQLARLTGLSEQYIELSNLRIDIQRFCKELLRSEGKTVGRLDSRLKGVEPDGAAERPEIDPSLTVIRPPYTSAMSQYAREVLKFETDREYFALGGGITSSWTFDLGPLGQGYAETATTLRQALSRNPYMKVLVASGYYDLATPFYATEYTLSHLGLDASLRGNIRVAEFEAGHMMYIHKPSLAKLKKDVDSFVDWATTR
jgi:carboxypeptidase C (cathepsin A)